MTQSTEHSGDAKLVAGAPYRSQWLMLAVCAFVGVLAAFGTFSSINNFPLIFALIFALTNLWEIWKQRSLGSVLPRLGLVVLAAGLASAGWGYHQQNVRSAVAAREAVIQTEMIGRSAPGFGTFEALNVSQAAFDDALEASAKVTLVTFWARWCSPCWKEMRELDALYREHGDRGLRVIGLTRYDRPDDPDAVQSDTDKARRFLERREQAFPAGIGTGTETYAGFSVSSIPTTVLIDQQGVITGYALGLESARELMRRAVALL